MTMQYSNQIAYPWANMHRKTFVRTKYGFFIDDDIDIITAQYQCSKSTNEKTIARH